MAKRRATARNTAVGNFIRANRGSAPARELMRRANAAVGGRVVRSNPRGDVSPILLLAVAGGGYWAYQRHKKTGRIF